MGSKGSNTKTETYTPNSNVNATGTQALTMAQTAANQPFQQQQAPVAGFADDQLSAFANMRAHQGYAEPYVNQAAGMYGNSAQPITGDQVNNYLNPYANYVLSNMRDGAGQQMKQTTGSLTQAAGGVGADRIGVAQANLAKQQQLAEGQTLAGIYGNALGAAQQDKGRMQSAAQGIGGLGFAGQNAAFQGDQMLFGAGQTQQNQQQNQLNAPYQWDLARIAHQYQMPQFLSGINSQTAPSLGGTKTQTLPEQSPWGTIAGLGMTAAGAFMGNPGMMGAGLKGTMGSQSGGMTAGGWGNTGGGWNPNVSGGYSYPAARGGRLPRAAGGRVTPLDVFRSFAGGGHAFADGGGVDWNLPQPGSFEDRFSAIGDNPRINAAMEFEQPLPEEASALPFQPQGPMPPPPALPPQITGQQEDEGMPPGAMGFAPQQPRPGAMPGPMPPAPPPPPQSETDLGLPPDPDEGSFARSPWLALMNAGLGTMAAAGKRDQHGMPTNPFAAIGEGGMKGVETLKVQDTAKTQRRRVGLEAKRLLNQAEHQRQSLGETRRYHDMTDQERRDRLRETILERRERSAENIRLREEREATRLAQQRIDAAKPIEIGTDQFGYKKFGIRDPQTGQITPIDPKTGRPVTDGAPGSSPASGPSPRPNPDQGVPAEGMLPLPQPPHQQDVNAGESEEIPSAARAVQAPHLRPEVLEELEPHQASQVRAIAEGRMPLPSGAALRAPAMQRLLYWVSQYDPTFDAVNYNSRSRTRQDFTSGRSAQNITSFNTAINHLSSFEKSIDKLENTNIPIVNTIGNWVRTNTGDTKIQAARTEFQAAKTALTEELTRAFRGTGGNVHDIKNWEKTMSDADSPAALRSSVKTAIELLRGRINEVTTQYNRGMGTTKDSMDIVSPAARATIERIEKRLEEGERPKEKKAAKKKDSQRPAQPKTKQIGDKTYNQDPNGDWHEE